MKPQNTDRTRQHGIETFYRNLALLEKFLETNKHFPSKNENEHLFQWMTHMRTKYNGGRLPGPFINKLNDLGFQWSVKEAKWYRLAQAVSEQLKEGKKLTMQEDPILFGWLRNSLDQYRNKQLTEDKRKIIEELQSGINQLKQHSSHSNLLVERMRELNWEEHFELLIQFRKGHTKCWPRRASDDQTERKLYKWCSLIRCIYRQGALSHVWVQKLREIGFKLNALLLVLTSIATIYP
jgi:hypothetical protein